MSQDIPTNVIGAIPLPIMTIDQDMLVAQTNQLLDLLLGPGLTGRHFINAIRQPALIDAVERCHDTQKPVEEQYLGRDGARDTHYAVHIAPVAGQIVLTFQDRTDAKAVGKLRRDFVANVSHELRTPLTGLLGFIETLRGPAKNDPAAQQRFLGFMEREAKRMSALIDDLLSLSRVEQTGRLRPATRIALGAVATATVAEINQMQGDAPHPISITDHSAGATVIADETQLRQVLVNLIQNALKYGDKSEPVQISISANTYQQGLRSEGIVLSVANAGDGIAAHHIPRLTERFYRVDSHRSREVGGTGLGLAIVKHIVNRHRGRLRITSDEGQGTEVSIVLPSV